MTGCRRAPAIRSLILLIACCCGLAAQTAHAVPETRGALLGSRAVLGVHRGLESPNHASRSSRTLQQAAAAPPTGGAAPPEEETWPVDFTDLDRAAETQRILRSVVAERNATAVAFANPDQAWADWLVRFNVTYNSSEIATYRRTVFNYNLAKSYQLNQLAGPEVAFGLNRFSVLTAEEFLQRFTGDIQDDSGISISPDKPQLVDTPAATALAAIRDAQLAAAAAAKAANATTNGTAANGTGGSNGTRPGAAGGGGLPGSQPPTPTTTPGTTSPPGGLPGGVQPPIVRPPVVRPQAVGAAIPTQPLAAASLSSAVLPAFRPPAELGYEMDTTAPQQQLFEAGEPARQLGSSKPGGSSSSSSSGSGPVTVAVTPLGASNLRQAGPVIAPDGQFVAALPAVAAGADPTGIDGGPAFVPDSSSSSSSSGGDGGSNGAGTADEAAGYSEEGSRRGSDGTAPPPAPATTQSFSEMPLDYSDYEQRHARGLLQHRDHSQHHNQHQQQQQQQPPMPMMVGENTVVMPDAPAAAPAALAGSSSGSSRTHPATSSADGSTPHPCGSGGVLQLEHHSNHQQQRSWLSRAMYRLQGLLSVLLWGGAGAGRSSSQQQQHQQHRWQQHQQHQQQVAASRKLQQAPGGYSLPSSFSYCSREVPFPYADARPFFSVDWLRAGIVRVPEFQGNCSNSFAFVAAGLAEAAMALQGYNGSAVDISEPQLMACFPHASCTSGGTVHVLLNYLACDGYAAAGPGSTGGGGAGNYPVKPTGTAADYSGRCAEGGYHPVETGITAWSYVPANELDLTKALSRVPAKVSVDAAILQSYRAGFIGCNVLSRAANHAMMAVGYNTQAFPLPAPPGTPVAARNFSRGAAYWMLKNSWGQQGSVDGFVYVAKGCQRATPLGMMLNRGVIPLWNQTESFRVGRLQCDGDDPANRQCKDNKALLLRLAGFCAGVPDYLPLREKTNCSCSCVPK